MRTLKGFKKTEKKNPQELFEAERLRFINNRGFNEYARILSECENWQSAIKRFRDLKEKCLAEAEVWRAKQYKKNSTKVNGYLHDDDREYSMTITAINENRRNNTIRNLERRAAEYTNFENILLSRIGI